MAHPSGSAQSRKGAKSSCDSESREQPRGSKSSREQKADPLLFHQSPITAIERKGPLNLVPRRCSLSLTPPWRASQWLRLISPCLGFFPSDPRNVYTRRLFLQYSAIFQYLLYIINYFKYIDRYWINRFVNYCIQWWFYFNSSFFIGYCNSCCYIIENNRRKSK